MCCAVDPSCVSSVVMLFRPGRPAVISGAGFLYTKRQILSTCMSLLFGRFILSFLDQGERLDSRRPTNGVEDWAMNSPMVGLGSDSTWPARSA